MPRRPAATQRWKASASLACLRRRLLIGLLVSSSALLGSTQAPQHVGAGTLISGPSLSVGSAADATGGLVNEGQRPNPASFSPGELQELQRRFGVHGPQPRLAQLFTSGMDQLTPLRSHTISRLEDLQPFVRREGRRTGINPMLLAAILFDEMQHAKPGEDLPIAAHSGLFNTHGPAQLGLSEMVKQGLLRPDAGPEELQAAREQLLDPERNVTLLAGKLQRILRELDQSPARTHDASRLPRHAKTVATLAYLHNGKLDYPTRILRYMQDPELHGVIYGQRREPLSPLI